MADPCILYDKEGEKLLIVMSGEAVDRKLQVIGGKTIVLHC